VPLGGLLYGETGDACPRSGVWAWVEDSVKAAVRKGDRMPGLDGRPVTWTWRRER
jgi:hypothetical protein